MTFDFSALRGDLDPVRERKRAGVAASRERAASGEKRAPKERAVKLEEARGRATVKRRAKLEERLEHIAVLDFETDPFDHLARDRIAPFTACLYSESFEPIIIWDENEETFVSRVIEEIEKLPGEYIIYAHNGGKFDFLFLISKLRGRVSFKGRGLMSANIGRHEIRDSYHLIPEKLSAYQKDEFDYSKLTKRNRKKNRAEIIRYMVNDCKYTYDIVKAFLGEYGIKMSIGQAAMALLKQKYPDVKSLHKNDDLFLRGFFYGGRVECIAGRGVWDGPFKLYDVNSMYPFVMAEYNHPVGNSYRPRVGRPDKSTVFVDIDCFSDRAFPSKAEGRGTLFPRGFGRFRVSIHEYNTAMELGLLAKVKFNYCVDCFEQTNFSDFVLPLYQARIETKQRLRSGDILEGSDLYYKIKRDDIFYKLLLNNAYGKFAQNPRRFKEFFITDADEEPSDERETWGDFPAELCGDYAIWQRPIKQLRFNNVGTAASITGAARSVLLRARASAIDPLYCDTDSLICRALPDTRLDPSALGAWDCEAELTRVMIAGKKLYGYETLDGKQKIRCKGGAGMSWEMLEQVTGGNVVMLPARAPTLTRRGDQRYIDRRISATI